MRQFRSETFPQLQSDQIDILQAHKDTIAYSRKQGNDYLVAMKTSDMNTFRQRLLNQTTQPNGNSMKTATVFPINKPEQVQMFAIESFEDRLKQHIETNFHVTLSCERITRAKGNIKLKINGSQDDVENAFQELENLFLLLNTKKFDDKNGKS